MSDFDVKDKIILKFHELALTYGIKRITIDMLAKECGISKKTVYKYYISKEDLIHKFADNIIENLNKEFDKIQLIEENPELVMTKFLEIIYEIIRNIPSTIITDARRFYPEIENKINRIRDEYTIIFMKTIKKGIKSGIFRSINPRFIEGFYTAAVNKVFNLDFILENNLTVQEAFNSFKTMLLFGLLNEKK
jgi:AcrR family transcriptional regulator